MVEGIKSSFDAHFVEVMEYVNVLEPHKGIYLENEGLDVATHAESSLEEWQALMDTFNEQAESTFCPDGQISCMCICRLCASACGMDCALGPFRKSYSPPFRSTRPSASLPRTTDVSKTSSCHLLGVVWTISTAHSQNSQLQSHPSC